MAILSDFFANEYPAFDTHQSIDDEDSSGPVDKESQYWQNNVNGHKATRQEPPEPDDSFPNLEVESLIDDSDTPEQPLIQHHSPTHSRSFAALHHPCITDFDLSTLGSNSTTPKHIPRGQSTEPPDDRSSFPGVGTSLQPLAAACIPQIHTDFWRIEDFQVSTIPKKRYIKFIYSELMG
jgi:hypothetical protein